MHSALLFLRSRPQLPLPLQAGWKDGEIRGRGNPGKSGDRRDVFGGAEFIRKLEQETGRSLTPRKGGRPPKGIVDKQEAFGFAK